MSTVVSSSTATGSSGNIYITGLSGIDTSALIQASVEAKMAPAYRLDTQIEALDAEVAGWEEMLSILEELNAAAAALSSDSESQVYDSYAGYLSSAGLSGAEDYVGVTVDDSEASPGIYEIVVEQLATSMKVSSGEVAKETELGLSGTMTLAAEGYEGADIEITEDMTIEEIAKSINAVSSDTGVAATLIATSDGNKTLVLSSIDTGTPFTATDTSGTVLQDLGVLDTNGDFADVLQEAQDAILTVDGVTVTSSSNDIEDIVPGVSLSIYDSTEGEAITLEVGQDLSEIVDAVEAFVDAYNAYRAFALEQQATEQDVGAAESAVLFGDSLLKGATNSLYDVMGMSVEIDGATYTLASFGITVGDDNMLEIDADVLEDALIQNPDVLQSFFQTSASTGSADLGVTQIPATVPSGDYELVVTVDADGKPATATLDGVEMEISGASIIGPEGSAFEGMRIVYTGDTDTTATISVTQGLADMLIATMETYTEDLIPNKIETLDESIADKQERRDEIEASAADYEDYLVEYYASLEAEIVAAETMLAQLEALLYPNSD
jgi:flagellar hook-associated protein 2